MHIITVHCPQCKVAYIAHVSSANFEAFNSVAESFIPQCIDCFVRGIHAPPDIKAEIAKMLKAIPYEIIP